jgi:hypothetical protein
MNSNEPEGHEERAEDFEMEAEETHQFNYQQIVPTFRDITYFIDDENPLNIPTPNIVNQTIEQLRNSDAFKEHRRELMGPQTEMQQFYTDLEVRHQNLIQEWERLNTPEGRLRLIEGLRALQNSIDCLIDRYNTNTREMERQSTRLCLSMITIFDAKKFKNQSNHTSMGIPPINQTEPLPQQIEGTEQDSQETDLPMLRLPTLQDIISNYSLSLTAQSLIFPSSENMGHEITNSAESIRIVRNYETLSQNIKNALNQFGEIGQLVIKGIEVNYEIALHLIERSKGIKNLINAWNQKILTLSQKN